MSFLENHDLLPDLGAPFRKNTSRNILMNSGILSQTVEVVLTVLSEFGASDGANYFVDVDPCFQPERNI